MAKIQGEDCNLKAQITEFMWEVVSKWTGEPCLLPCFCSETDQNQLKPQFLSFFYDAKENCIQIQSFLHAGVSNFYYNFQVKMHKLRQTKDGTGSSCSGRVLKTTCGPLSCWLFSFVLMEPGDKALLSLFFLSSGAAAGRHCGPRCALFDVTAEVNRSCKHLTQLLYGEHLNVS